MPVWLQHTLVFLLVAACLAVVVREAVRALGRRGGKTAGCGTCGGCETQERQAPEASKPVGDRVVFLSADALSARVGSRYKK